MSRLSIRVNEASTWKGLVYIATATTLGLYPQLAKEVTIIAFGLSGIIGILFSEVPYTGPEVELPKTPTVAP